jgi:DNA-directed RNA polymerase subunit RPC12/RpoP
MDSDNLLIVCRSCGRKVLMHNMKPDGTGENMICIDCYKKGLATRPTMSLKEAAAQAEASKVKKPATNEPMRKYICTSCKYKFSRKKSQEVSKCPYCGKNSIVSDNNLGAEKLITDSLDKRFEKW